MTTSEWFCSQLRVSADGFVWGAQQIPSARRMAAPPTGLGEWSVTRHVFHLYYYEQHYSLPSIRQWQDELQPSFDNLDEDLAWGDGQDFEASLDQFRQVRAAQVDLLSRVDETLWQKVLTTGWGVVSLHWVMSKTYQHTTEHISDVLRIALFWDRFAAR